MNTNLKTLRLPTLGTSLGMTLSLLVLATALPCRAQDKAAAPRIISLSPKNSQTDVDPALKELSVTFNRDMQEGCSWTGGGPEFPSIPEGQKAQWRDKRTCVLPVKLEAGHLYRVGLNSPSFRNFRSSAGVAVPPTTLSFTTQGASAELKAQVSKPLIVGLSPRNGDQAVDPGLTELQVTFNVPMNESCSWCGGGPEYPTIPQGQNPRWSADHKTCTLPVQLQPGSQYRLGLNSVSFKGFRSAGGLPLEPVAYSFKTR